MPNSLYRASTIFNSISDQHRKYLLYPLLVFIVAFSVFIPSLKNGFVWDDNLFLANKIDSFTLKTIPYYFYPESDIYTGNTNYYRPVLLSSLSLENVLWHGRAAGFHFTNIFIHSLNSVLVYFLLLMLLREFKYEYTPDKTAFLSAVLFALHPIHVESVSFILARSDLLCLFFMVLSIIFYILSKNSIYYMIGSILFLLLCVFSKETGIVAPVLIVIYQILKPNSRIYRAFVISMISAGIIILYLLIRARIFSLIPGSDTDFFNLQSLITLIYFLIKSASYYYYKLIFPFRFNAYVLHIPHDYPHLSIYTVIFISILFSFYYFTKHANYIALFGNCWILITLFPALLLPTIYMKESTFSDRFLYIPSIGFCLLLALLYYKLKNKLDYSYLYIFTALPLLTLYIFYTFNEQRVWESDLTLWTTTVNRSPDYVIPRMNYGYALFKNGDTQRALSEFRKSIGENIEGTGSQKSAASENIAFVYMLTGKYHKAQNYLDKALQYDPGYKPHYHFNLALISFLKLQSLKPGDKNTELFSKRTSYLLNEAYKINSKSVKLKLLIAEFYHSRVIKNLQINLHGNH